MAIYHDWPWSNIHGINLNWVIEQVKRCIDGYNTLGDEVKDLKDYIHEHLSEEAIKEDVKEELQKLIDSGELDEIIEEILNGKLDRENYFSTTWGIGFENPSEAEMEIINQYSAINDQSTVDDYYRLYDYLQEENSDIIEKQTLEYTSGGYIYAYKINAEVQKSVTDTFYNDTGMRPNVLITTGIHGNEKAPIVATYLFFKKVLENRKEFSALLNKNIMIIPCCNPYGINNNIRYNENGVDLNRNFPYRWASGTSPYKGPSAGSEKSTQAIMQAFNDMGGMFIIDLHGMRYADATGDRMVVNAGSNFTGPNAKSGQIMDVFGYMTQFMKRTYPQLEASSPDLYARIDNAKGISGNFMAWAYSKGAKSSYCECPYHWTDDLIVSPDEYKCAYTIDSTWLYNQISTFYNEAPYIITDWRNLGVDGSEVASWEDVLRLPRYSEARLCCSVNSPLLESAIPYFSAETEMVYMEIKRGGTFGAPGKSYDAEYFIVTVRELLKGTTSFPPTQYTGIIRYYDGHVYGPDWQYDGVSPKGRLGSSEYGSANLIRDVNDPDFVRQLNHFGWYADFYNKEDALANHLPMGGQYAGFLIACRPVVYGTRCFVFFYFTDNAYMFYKMGRSLNPTDGNWMQVKKDRYDNPT